MRDVRAHYQNPDLVHPGETNLMTDITQQLTNTGIHNPLAQIYITTEPIEELPTLIFLFTITQVIPVCGC